MADDALSEIRRAFEASGIESLGALADELWGLHQQDYSDAAIYEWLVQQDVYKQEFSGLVTLREQGAAAGYNEADYLAERKAMRQVLTRAGFGGTSFDTNEYVGEVIGNQVSMDEFTTRIQMAEAAAATLPQDVRDELRTRYGITGPNVVAYYLETDRTEQDLLKQQEAAQLASAYSKFQTGYVATETFESLAQQVDERQALEAIGRLGTLGGGLTDQQRIEGAFGLNRLVDAQRRARAAEFSGGGEAVGTQEGLSGLSSASSS
jgi:hypothetical protein